MVANDDSNKFGWKLKGDGKRDNQRRGWYRQNTKFERLEDGGA